MFDCGSRFVNVPQTRDHHFFVCVHTSESQRQNANIGVLKRDAKKNIQKLLL